VAHKCNFARITIDSPVLQCVLCIYQGLRVKLQAPAVWSGRQPLAKCTVYVSWHEMTQRLRASED
jgi:hypothetical protein